jgi:hypothetical protein
MIEKAKKVVNLRIFLPVGRQTVNEANKNVNSPSAAGLAPV